MMSHICQFQSALAPVMDRHVAHKRTLGRSFESGAYILEGVDRFLSTHNAPDLTEEIFSAWTSSIGHLTPSGRRGRMRVIYHFCLYQQRSSPDCFVPDPSQFPLPHPRSRPYIFSEEEIVRLLIASDALSSNCLSPLRRHVARLAIVLLYTTGLRRGELVRLTIGDYDPAERLLTVRDSKFHKSRLIPLSDDAAEEMNRYLKNRRRSGFPRRVDSPLFLNGHGGFSGYTGPGFACLIRKIFCLSRVKTADGRLPRVHDLRFTFAVHALLHWYRTGADVQARLPSLSIYMGHVSVASTQYYLTFLDEIAQKASERFDSHCSIFLELPTGGAL